MDSSICLDAPLSLDFGCSPRFAASAAPAAFCWAFDVAGMGSLLRVIQRANGQRVAPVARRRQSSSFPVQAFILFLEDRQSVVWGKSVSVRVVLGGGRVI